MLVNPRNAAAGSLRQKDPAMTATPQAVVLGVPARRSGRRARVRRRTTTTLEYIGRLGLPVNPEVRMLDSVEAVVAALRALAGAPPRPRLRDRRRGDQGRRPRAARPAGFHVARAALGDRLQVPARGAHDVAARHPDLGRAHRTGDAVRRARAGVRRRVDGRRWRRSTTRTRWPSRTCAPATP